MHALRTQYFLTFALMGSLVPYIPVYFKHRGLSETQIGMVFAIASFALVLSPAIATFLADTRFDARRLLCVAFILAGLLLLGLPLAQGTLAIVAVWTLHTLAATPLTPLQDGINFALQRRRAESGLRVIPYHRVRVWGTIGFIIPSLLLWALMGWGWPVSIILGVAMVCAALGAINTFRLPDAKIRLQPDPAALLPDDAQLPTAAALRILLKPPVLVFCIAVFLIHMAGAAYYTFYPLYLTDEVGLNEMWLGPISNLGVVVEIFFMLAFGYLMRHWGLRWIMILGVLAMASRFALLAAMPTVAVAAGTQIFHGMMVLVMHVAPAVYLDRHADDHCRHSIQGLFVMLIYGLGRIAGSLAAGPIAQWSLTGVQVWASGLCAIAAVLLVLAFKDRRP